RDFHVTGVQTCALPIWRLVQDLRRLGAVNQHRLRLSELFGGRLAPLRLRSRGYFAARGYAQDLSGGEPVFGAGALSVDADLPRAGPTRHGREADLRQVALEPAVEPDVVVIVRDGELADLLVRSGAVGHPATRIAM